MEGAINPRYTLPEVKRQAPNDLGGGTTGFNSVVEAVSYPFLTPYATENMGKRPTVIRELSDMQVQWAIENKIQKLLTDKELALSIKDLMHDPIFLGSENHAVLRHDLLTRMQAEVGFQGFRTPASGTLEQNETEIIKEYQKIYTSSPLEYVQHIMAAKGLTKQDGVPLTIDWAAGQLIHFQPQQAALFWMKIYQAIGQQYESSNQKPPDPNNYDFSSLLTEYKQLYKKELSDEVTEYYAKKLRAPDRKYAGLVQSYFPPSITHNTGSGGERPLLGFVGDDDLGIDNNRNTILSSVIGRRHDSLLGKNYQHLNQEMIRGGNPHRNRQIWTILDAHIEHYVAQFGGSERVFGLKDGKIFHVQEGMKYIIHSQPLDTTGYFEKRGQVVDIVYYVDDGIASEWVQLELTDSHFIDALAKKVWPGVIGDKIRRDPTNEVMLCNFSSTDYSGLPFLKEPQPGQKPRIDKEEMPPVLPIKPALEY